MDGEYIAGVDWVLRGAREIWRAASGFDVTGIQNISTTWETGKPATLKEQKPKLLMNRKLSYIPRGIRWVEHVAYICKIM
jgi:hypothetical protein